MYFILMSKKSLTDQNTVKEGIDKLVDLYFQQPKILYSHLFSSYHQMIEEIIPHTLTKEPNYFYEKVTPEEIFNYGFKFEDVKIFPPIRERDNEIIYPHMARKNFLNYFANIQAKVTQFQERIDLVTGEKTSRNIGEPEVTIVGSVPVMVKSRYCSTYLKPETSKYECKYDPGGYFIVNGQEKVIVSIEKMADNKMLVFSRNDSSYPTGKVYNIQINSRKHDWSDNLQIINIKNLKDNSLVITTSQFVEVPIMIFLRALGIESDGELTARISNNLEDIPMVNMIRESLNNSVTEDSKVIKTRDEAIDYLITKLKSNRRIIQSDETLAYQQKKIYLEKILKKDILPHLGEDVPLKVSYVCMMLRKLLEVMIGREQEDDRDSFENKRVETPGVLIGQLFRQNFKKMLNEVSKLFRKKNTSDEKPVNMISQIKPSIIEQGIKTGLATGVWGLSKTKKGVAQSLSRLSYLQTVSYLRRIKSPSLETSTSKITSIRQVNNIQAFFVCNIETPEGAQIGLVKSLSLMSTVSPSLDGQKKLLDELISNNEKVKHPFMINPEDLDDYVKVFLNGKWMGCIEVKEGLTFYENLREMRRKGTIDKMVTLTMDYFKKEVKIFTESGRLIRPLLKVDDNMINITSQMISEIDKELVSEKKETGWNRILLKYPNLVEYEDIECTNNMMISIDPHFLREARENSLRKVEKSKEIVKSNRYGKYRYMKYTHSEFHPSFLLGTIVSIVPFINHNPATRGIIFFSQAKQAIGMYATNYKDRMDISNVLYNPHIPLVTTKAMKYNRFLDMPSGENAIVAILCYTGYNQEDSIVVNKSAIDRGLFCADTLKKYFSKIEMNPSTSADDIFMKPDRTKVTGMSQGNYNKINDDGFAPEETFITDKDMIIGKVSPIQPTGDNKVYKDKSETFKTNVDGYVDRVHHDIYDGDGYKMVNMRVRMERKPIVGDKFSTRHGQKGTTGLLVPQRDMPFTEEGMIPDIIFNPHGMPSRETIGQLLETICSKVSALTGKLFDGTPFNEYDVYQVPEILKGLGYQQYGTETMYNGITGQKMKAQIFIGPVYYLRLKHMVNDKLHCLTPDHEVLTDNGWKYIEDVNTSDKIACLINDNLEYHNYKEKFEYDYDGKMYHIKSQLVNQVVTPNHKMYVSKCHTKKRIWSDYYLEEAKDLFGKHRKYKRDANWISKEYQFVLPSVISNNILQKECIVDMDSWITFFGIWIAEGWCNQVDKDNKIYTISIAANKQRVKDKVCPALEKLGYNFKIYSEKLIINNKQLYEYMKVLSVGAPNKFLPEWVWKLNKNQCQKLIHAMCLGDGCFKNNDADLYYTSSDRLADDFMRLCLHAGWSSNKTIHSYKGSETTINNRKVISNYDLYRLSIIRTKNNPSVNHGHKNNSLDEKWIDYQGKVYCFEVPNNIFYIRKNGIPGWTGNSRSTGPKQAITRQPLEGRAKEGGLRIGEMEQNSMVAHGVGQYLKERMMEDSDITTVHVCDKCGLFASKVMDKDYYQCLSCNNTTDISEVSVPYAFKLMVQELTSVNVLPRIRTE